MNLKNRKFTMHVLITTVMFITLIVVVSWMRSPTNSSFQDADAQSIINVPQQVVIPDPDAKPKWKVPKYNPIEKIDSTLEYTLYMFVGGNGGCYEGLAHAESHMMGDMSPYITRLTTVEGAIFDVTGRGRIGVYHNESQRLFLEQTLYAGDHTKCVVPPELPNDATDRWYDHN